MKLEAKRQSAVEHFTSLFMNLKITCLWLTGRQLNKSYEDHFLHFGVITGCIQVTKNMPDFIENGKVSSNSKSKSGTHLRIAIVGMLSGPC